MLFIWLNNMLRNILYVDLADFISSFNYVVIFFCYLLSFCCQSAGNECGYRHLDTHRVWGQMPNLLPT